MVDPIFAESGMGKSSGNVGGISPLPNKICGAALPGAIVELFADATAVVAVVAVTDPEQAAATSTSTTTNLRIAVEGLCLIEASVELCSFPIQRSLFDVASRR